MNRAGAQDIPISRLVLEVYESASPRVKSRMLTQLVGQVYETAPPLLRSRLLEQLMRPLGVLSLLAVADGIFAKIQFRSEWRQFQVRLDDAASVRASDVIALVDLVQQVSVEAVNGLGQMLASALVTSSWVAGSAAASVLVTLLLGRTRV